MNTDIDLNASVSARSLIQTLVAATLHERDAHAAQARVRSLSNGLADDLETLARWIRVEQQELSTTDLSEVNVGTKAKPKSKPAAKPKPNLVSTKVLAHVATVSATPVGAPATPTVAAPEG